MANSKVETVLKVCGRLLLFSLLLSPRRDLMLDIEALDGEDIKKHCSQTGMAKSISISFAYVSATTLAESGPDPDAVAWGWMNQDSHDYLYVDLLPCARLGKKRTLVLGTCPMKQKRSFSCRPLFRSPYITSHTAQHPTTKHCTRRRLHHDCSDLAR